MSFSLKTRNSSDAKHRILLSLVLSIGILLCLVNALYLVHFVEFHTFVTDIQSTNHIHNMDGKERLIQMLKHAGITNITSAQLSQLPSWNDVVSMYGDSPKIVGLETCQTFTETISSHSRLLAPAGVFNSGTNLLAELLLKNCVLPRHGKGTGVRWQVNWGKHQPPRFRNSHYLDVSIKNNSVIMPVVTIRDPYSWLQSMCRHRYSAHWFHPPHHCPNFVPDERDYEFLQYANVYKRAKFRKFHHDDPWLVDNVMNTANFNKTQTVVPLYVRYKLINTTHTSLAHLWNDWYNEYMVGDFPRIVVRMEDLVFHAEQVIQQVCTCVGGTFAATDFQYIIDSAKHGEIHGNDKTSLLDAMIRYGSRRQDHTRGMTQDDLDYARKVLDEKLMHMFGYSHPIHR